MAEDKSLEKQKTIASSGGKTAALLAVLFTIGFLIYYVSERAYAQHEAEKRAKIEAAAQAEAAAIAKAKAEADAALAKIWRSQTVPQGSWSFKIDPSFPYKADALEGRRVRIDGDNIRIRHWVPGDRNFKVVSDAKYIEIMCETQEISVGGVPYDQPVTSSTKGATDTGTRRP